MRAIVVCAAFCIASPAVRDSGRVRRRARRTVRVESAVCAWLSSESTRSHSRLWRRPAAKQNIAPSKRSRVNLVVRLRLSEELISPGRNAARAGAPLGPDGAGGGRGPRTLYCDYARHRSSSTGVDVRVWTADQHLKRRIKIHVCLTLRVLAAGASCDSAAGPCGAGWRARSVPPRPGKRGPRRTGTAVAAPL